MRWRSTRTSSGSTFATIVVGDHRETWPLQSKAFRQWLARQFYLQCKKAPPTQALVDALNVLVGRALYDGPEYKVAIRLAQSGGDVWLDLADVEWRAVRVTRDGWSVVASTEVPIRFKRRRGMLPLPVPVPGGRIDELRDFVNLPDDYAWTLFVAYLVGALSPSGPYPVLVVNGEHGSAKSTLCRFARSLIDPNMAPLRLPTRDDRDLMIAANNGWIIGYDNLSRIPASMSDALCALATGSGFGTRELYSDDEEKLFSATRPIMVNGITDLATRSDLVDRAVQLVLQPIPDKRRLDEATLHAQFNDARPRLLGALLDAVSVAVRNRADVRLETMPRMADFAIWVTAAEPALGWEPGRLLRVYTANRARANDLALAFLDLSPQHLSGAVTSYRITLMVCLRDVAARATKQAVKSGKNSGRALIGWSPMG